MAKLYWATDRESADWHACESREEAIAQARARGMGVVGDYQAIWVAPADAQFDDDDQFWACVAACMLWNLENINERVVEEGWADPEEEWLSEYTVTDDADATLANALRKIFPPRPEWRTVDVLKAERVEL